MDILSNVIALAETLDFNRIFPFVLVAVAVAVIVATLYKKISSYRAMKQSQKQQYARRSNGTAEIPHALLEIRGEYFVLKKGETYSVGEDGQLKEGKYLLKNADAAFSQFSGEVCGAEKTFEGQIDLQFATGDTFRCISGDILIKPIAYGSNANSATKE